MNVSVSKKKKTLKIMIIQ